MKKPYAVSRIQAWARVALLCLTSLGISTGINTLSEKLHRTVPVATDKAHTKNIPGTLVEEQMHDPALTEQRYLDLLASRLTSPDELHYFFLEKLENTKDYNKNETLEDHWQTPEETVRRVQSVTRKRILNDGMGGVKTYSQLAMCGDCEDYAFLAQEILWRQGKVAHVVYFPEGHSACVWIERRPDGRYDGFCLDQGGVDHNGRTLDRPSLEHTKGCESVLDAFNKSIEKFENLKWYNMNPAVIPIDRIRGGVRYIDAVTIQAFDPDCPHLPSYDDFALTLTIIGGTYATYRFIWRPKAGETFKKWLTTFRLT